MHTTPWPFSRDRRDTWFHWAVTTATDPLRLRVRIDADPDTVFKALTDSDELAEWLAESAEVALDQGRYEFWGRYAPQGDRARQTLTGHEAGRLLRYTWTFDEGPSTVELALSPDGDGTVVAVSHTGIPSAGSADGNALRCFWYVSLANLVAHSEGTQTMPPFDFSVPAQGDALVRTVIDVPVEEVFASLLDPASLDKWVGGQGDRGTAGRRAVRLRVGQPWTGADHRVRAGQGARLLVAVAGQPRHGRTVGAAQLTWLDLCHAGPQWIRRRQGGRGVPAGLAGVPGRDQADA